MIQSESLTWPAIVARAKTVTRRTWKPSTRAWYRKGRVFDAYDTATFRGGKRIARCQVTQDAYEECLGDMPDDDWEGEGFAWMSDHAVAIPGKARPYIWAQGDCSFAAFNQWRDEEEDRVYSVCRFVIVEVEPWAVEKLNQILLSGGVLK